MLIIKRAASFVNQKYFSMDHQPIFPPLATKLISRLKEALLLAPNPLPNTHPTSISQKENDKSLNLKRLFSTSKTFELLMTDVDPFFFISFVHS